MLGKVWKCWGCLKSEERCGEMCWGVGGGQGRCGEKGVGVCGEVCWGVGEVKKVVRKCVGVWGRCGVFEIVGKGVGT